MPSATLKTFSGAIQPLKEMKVKVKLLSHVWLFATPWTVAHQAPPSTGFSRQEYWSGLPNGATCAKPTKPRLNTSLHCSFIPYQEWNLKPAHLEWPGQHWWGHPPDGALPSLQEGDLTTQLFANNFLVLPASAIHVFPFVQLLSNC